MAVQDLERLRAEERRTRVEWEIAQEANQKLYEGQTPTPALSDAWDRAKTREDETLAAHRAASAALQQAEQAATPTSDDLRIAYEDADAKHRAEHTRFFPVRTFTGRLDLSGLQSPTPEDLTRLETLHEESLRLHREWFSALREGH